MCDVWFRQRVRLVSPSLIRNLLPTFDCLDFLADHAPYLRSSSSELTSTKEHPQSIAKGPLSSHTSLPAASAPISQSSTTLSLSQASNIPCHRDHALNRFYSDIESSHPAYQYSEPEGSMLAYTARAKSILDDFDATYYKE